MVCIKLLKKHSRLRGSLQTQLGIGNQNLNLVLVDLSLIVLFGINQRHLKTRIHLKTNIKLFKCHIQSRYLFIDLYAI